VAIRLRLDRGTWSETLQMIEDHAVARVDACCHDTLAVHLRA
jgi:hypothetical protein